MKKIFVFVFVLQIFQIQAQCDPELVALSMNIYTDSWGYETYWDLVPGTNACGDGTLAWGSNIETVGCSGAGEQNAGGSEFAYPPNTVVQVDNICLTPGELYTLYFIDDWGDGGLYFEMFQDGNLVGIYQGTGIGNAWTFEAGLNPLGPHDSPCNALEVLPLIGNAVDLNNSNCYTQVNEITPFLGHCMADGAWCDDPAQHTVWAKFIVPDSGSYEISTVHYGTSINTQMAVWYSDDCANPDNFILLSANDDYWGDSNLSSCNANPPDCVNQSSAAFLNVVETFPLCCENGWDENCQMLYDQLSASCSSPANCAYTLLGYDSYGDGWNDCAVVVTINGLPTTYTFNEGGSAQWNIPFLEGDNVDFAFLVGNWPEEVSIQLISPFNEILFEGPLLNQPTPFFDIISSCTAPLIAHPQASRTYVHCLPAGVTCYIQIDGYQNAIGSVVLSVTPYSGSPAITAQTTDLYCPVTIGIPSQAMIITHVDGWSLNHSAVWSGPNDYTSEDFHITQLEPGAYTVTFQDGCNHTLESTFTIAGPEPFVITSESSPSCSDQFDGSIEASIAGGTAPYESFWQFPDGTIEDGLAQQNLTSGLYQLIITDDHDCTIMAPVWVDSLATPVFSLGPDLTVCEEFAIQLLGPDSAAIYAWSDGSDLAYLNLFSENYPTGEYPIQLQVTNEEGCSFQDSLILLVEECIAVDEIENAIGIYPIPAHSKLYINGRFDSLQLFSSNGQVIACANGSENPFHELDTQNLPNGIYALNIRTAYSVTTKTIVIQH